MGLGGGPRKRPGPSMIAGGGSLARADCRPYRGNSHLVAQACEEESAHEIIGAVVGICVAIQVEGRVLVEHVLYACSDREVLHRVRTGEVPVCNLVNPIVR